jgi:pseudouridine-5'-phosphate glycosidase
MALLELSASVREALDAGRPVVALESTIISHGFPRPRNLEAAHLFESILTDAGVVPATVAVIDGVPKVGLTKGDLERIAQDEAVVKVSSRDLGIAIAQRRTGATTVAATSVLAARAGIRVFSTGGLGGVHRRAIDTFDESADLTVLSRTRITVVAAGVKSILDIPATLERLETLSVAVVGFGTTRFPGFWLTDSGHPVDWSVNDAEAVADVMAARDALDDPSALLVANPLPAAQQLDPTVHDEALAQALEAAERAGIRGKAVSPFLLDYIQRATAGRSLDVNIDIASNNVAVGGAIAKAWAARR